MMRQLLGGLSGHQGSLNFCQDGLGLVQFQAERLRAKGLALALK